MLVAKWGNSLAVRLPKELVETLGLQPGDDIELVPAGVRRFEVIKDEARERAVARMAARQWRLPEDYRFDRDEANGR